MKKNKLNKDGKEPKKARDIVAPDFMGVVWKHLTEEVCQEVFEVTRDKERERKWTLFALLKMWMGLLLTGLASQTVAVEECGKEHPLFPKVDASPESFFMRVQKIRPAFFRNIFTRFKEQTAGEYPGEFQEGLGISKEEFPEIQALDGSRLAKVGRVLKVSRKTTKAIIPGSMEAVYDMRRGRLRDLWFDPDGAKSELWMFEEVLKNLVKGSLLAADRYYAKPVIWEQLNAAGIWMVTRHNKTVGKKRIKVLKKRRNSKVSLDDWLVEMGGSQKGSKAVLLRWVHVWNSEVNLILITNVLEPSRLSVDQLLGLYRQRWSIERMYLHLKEVLSLNNLFNASPSAVAQQVYATAILYNALRLSQALIAKRLEISPERISPDKLFPRLIEKLLQMTWMETGFVLRNERDLPRSWGEIDKELLEHPSMRISVKGILVEKRLGKRRQKRFCKGKKTWTTYRKIPGAMKYIKN